MKENLLKKEFKYRDVQRARNIIKKDYNARTLEGVGYQKSFEKKKEGDIWEEDGKSWTLKNGIKQSVSKLDLVRKDVTKPLLCPSCSSIMNYRLDNKMWKIHGICYDCVIDMEHKLRVLGKYAEYESAMITGNLMAWAEDMQVYVEDILQETETHVTEEGDIEDWRSNTDEQKRKVLVNMQDYLSQVTKAVDGLDTKLK